MSLERESQSKVTSDLDTHVPNNFWLSDTKDHFLGYRKLAQEDDEFSNI